MNQTSTESRSAPLISAFDSLLAATNAFKNFRAILLLGMTLVAMILVVAIFGFLGTKTGSAFVGFLGGLLAFVIVFYGANAVGILLMQEAQGEPQHGMLDAVLLSLSISHRLLGVAILELLIVLAVVLAVALVLFICKIPVLGPFLFAFVLPASAVLLGMLVFSLFYIMLPLAGPAVWSGSTTFQVIARLNTIAKTKLISVIIQQFILFIILMFAAGIIFAVIMIGFSMATSLSAAIIGAGGMNMAELMSGGAMFGEISGHMIAGGIGGGVLFAVAAVIPALIGIKGSCIIYLNITQGLDFTQAEAQLETGMAAVKKKADEARERARHLAEQQAVRNAPTSAPPTAAPPAPTPAAALLCPSCSTPVTADDVFCGNCGHKLK